MRDIAGDPADRPYDAMADIVGITAFNAAHRYDSMADIVEITAFNARHRGRSAGSPLRCDGSH
jgi:hypothetical protein